MTEKPSNMSFQPWRRAIPPHKSNLEFLEELGDEIDQKRAKGERTVCRNATETRSEAEGMEDAQGTG